MRRPRIAAAAKPNSAIIGGAGTSVPLLLPEVDELVEDEVELDVEVEDEVELELDVLVLSLTHIRRCRRTTPCITWWSSFHY